MRLEQDGEDLVRVAVSLGPRSYEILIGGGLVARAGRAVAGLGEGIRAAIVVDETVAGFHLERLKASLDAVGVAATPIIVPPGEQTKSMAMLERVTDAILAARLERGDAVVALGGGVVGDLAGFAAGIVRRGMALVQMPTTLLDRKSVV